MNRVLLTVDNGHGLEGAGGLDSLGLAKGGKGVSGHVSIPCLIQYSQYPAFIIKRQQLKCPRKTRS
jgi:hypothetical protein